MKTILVVTFMLFNAEGTGYNISVWRKTLENEYICEKTAERIKHRVKDAKVECRAPVVYLKKTQK